MHICNKCKVFKILDIKIAISVSNETRIIVLTVSIPRLWLFLFNPIVHKQYLGYKMGFVYLILQANHSKYIITYICHLVQR